MKEILFNVALIDSIEYCKEHSIDCSGTHLMKYSRGFTYALVQDSTGAALLTTTFYKNRTPSRYVHTVTA
jgi:hypothetical protein